MAPGVAYGGGGTKAIFFAPMHIFGCLGQSFELSNEHISSYTTSRLPEYMQAKIQWHIHIRRPAPNLSSCIEIANTFSIVKQLTLTSLNQP